MRRWTALLAFGVLAIATVSTARADEIVYFANGAEMPVRAHTLEKDMVKLDLGGNSFISFPLSMVDKIADAGKDVFLNPAYHPVNQAVEGSHLTPVPIEQNNVHDRGATVGYRPQPGAGNSGMSLGEPTIGSDSKYSKSTSGPPSQIVPNTHGLISRVGRPAVDLSQPVPPTGQAVIPPPDGTTNTHGRMLLKPRAPQGAPPVGSPAESTPPADNSAPPATPPPPPPPPADSGQDSGSSDDSPGQP